MNTTIQYRIEFNENNYTVKKRMPKVKARIANRHTMRKASTVKNEEIKSAQNSQPNDKNYSKQQNPNGPKSSTGSLSPLSSGNSHGNLMASIGSMENKIFALGVKLSQAPMEQRAQIQSQIDALKIQLTRMHHQLAEAKKVEKNKTGPTKHRFR
jgi:hypothetical protein